MLVARPVLWWIANAVFDTFRELRGTIHSKTGQRGESFVSLLYGGDAHCTEPRPVVGRPVCSSLFCRLEAQGSYPRFMIAMNSFTRLLRYNPAAVQDHGCGLDFDALLRLSMEELLLKTQTHQDTWLFGKEEQWNLDPGQAELVFSFPGRLVVPPAQII